MAGCLHFGKIGKQLSSKLGHLAAVSSAKLFMTDNVVLASTLRAKTSKFQQRALSRITDNDNLPIEPSSTSPYNPELLQPLLLQVSRRSSPPSQLEGGLCEETISKARPDYVLKHNETANISMAAWNP